MADYPRIITPRHIEPVPRRIRAVHGDTVLFDSSNALYVWEWAYYPQYYIPRRDVREDLLVPDVQVEVSPGTTIRAYSFADGGPEGPPVARLIVDSETVKVVDTFRFEWDSLDAWFEEDEEVFVHPRNPYSRVDALRSTRVVRIELDGVVLAESASPVMVFETGLPTRYYLNRTEVRFDHLEFSPTVTRCPYKGTTTAYWSVVIGDARHEDLAWSYHFPTRELLPIAGLVAFYNEKVDVFVDGELEPRPVTHFSD
jgi:uncharacterized protein (DUF427 family)